MAGSAGTLYVTVAAKTDQLTKGLNKGRKEVSGFARFTNSTLSKLGGAMAGAFALERLGASFLSTANAIEDMANSATKLGVGTEVMSKLGHVALMSDVSTKTLNTSLAKLGKTIGDAQAGSTTAIDKFTKLGVSLDSITDIPLDQALGLISDRINALPSATDKLSASMSLFGKAGSEMLLVTQQGSAGIAALGAELENLGGVVSQAEADKIIKFNDSLDRLKTTIGGAWKDFVIDITPLALSAVEQLSGMLKSNATPNETWGEWTDRNFNPFKQFKLREDGGGLIPWLLKDWEDWQSQGARTPNFAWHPEAMAGELPPNKFPKEWGKKAFAGESDVVRLLGAVPKRMADVFGNTAKNLAAIGGKGLDALDPLGNWNAAQRAALLQPFAQRPGGEKAEAKLGGDMPGMVRDLSKLALTQSGTVESYRQRMAIAKQGNPMLELGKKQLNAAERTAKGVESLVGGALVVAPANLRA